MNEGNVAVREEYGSNSTVWILGAAAGSQAPDTLSCPVGAAPATWMSMARNQCDDGLSSRRSRAPGEDCDRQRGGSCMCVLAFFKDWQHDRSFCEAMLPRRQFSFSESVECERWPLLRSCHSREIWLLSLLVLMLVLLFSSRPQLHPQFSPSPTPLSPAPG